MHIQTHVMSGWCVGNLFRFNARERLFCMLAASLADLDGLGILISQEAYWDYHHKLGHCALFGIVLASVLTVFSTHRRKAFLVYLGLFHLHLVLDYFGSGPNWPLHYLWPFSEWGMENGNAWPFYSWQNISTGLAFLAWVIVIAIRQGRTPLEAIMPKLDLQLVHWVRKLRGMPVRCVAFLLIVLCTSLTPGCGRQEDADLKRKKSMERAIGKLATSLESTDRIEVNLLKPVVNYRAKSGFPVAPYNAFAKIVATKEFPASQVRSFVELWNTFIKDDAGQFACHEAIYGLRFYRKDKLLYETTICFRCSNYSVPVGRESRWRGMTADAEIIKKMLVTLESAIPIPPEFKKPPKIEDD